MIVRLNVSKVQMRLQGLRGKKGGSVSIYWRFLRAPTGYYYQATWAEKQTKVKEDKGELTTHNNEESDVISGTCQTS